MTTNDDRTSDASAPPPDGPPADPRAAGHDANGDVPKPDPDALAPTPSGASDRVLLEGAHSRLQEMLLLARAVFDFIRGFRALHFVGPCVTIFGSARFSEQSPYYPIAREVGRRVSALGFTVLTGGGPGLMEAANRGARDVGGRSVGCNIELPTEQFPNPYLDRWVSCHYFFVRKVLLFKYSYAFIVMPGGLGTLDEMCEGLTLIQTGKIREFPVILIGTEYWKPFLALLGEMVERGSVGKNDLNLLKVTDSLDEAMDHLEAHAVKAFGLRRVPWHRPKWWLGERGLGRFAAS